MSTAYVGEGGGWLDWTAGTYWEKVTPGSSKGLKGGCPGEAGFC